MSHRSLVFLYLLHYLQIPTLDNVYKVKEVHDLFKSGGGGGGTQYFPAREASLRSNF